ncbi:MAG: HEAT repeat domain-containing protein [Nitrospirae bacterium]|nr:MAG: HEAT repeat domain-containing protein [Nitrospirota bacterium]
MRFPCAKPLRSHAQPGQASLASVLILLALIALGIWGWNHLPFDVQDLITEDILPVALIVLAVGGLIWTLVRLIQRRRQRRRQRDQLIQQFTQETSLRKRFDLAVAIIELNNYELAGLEQIAPEMAKVFIAIYKTSPGDKQHRFRGMAASHLGVLQHRDSIPLLLKALDDDHAYVRGCAALALGRMRAKEAKAKLTYMMKEDWDQTVRSRSREAVERIP